MLLLKVEPHNSDKGYEGTERKDDNERPYKHSIHIAIFERKGEYQRKRCANEADDCIEALHNVISLPSLVLTQKATGSYTRGFISVI